MDGDAPHQDPGHGEYHLCGDCRKCGKKPVFTEITVENGKKSEKLLCEECAKAQGVAGSGVPPALGKLVGNMIGGQAGLSPAKSKNKPTTVCQDCGLTFAQFRETGLLGCSACYQAFEKHLSPLLERAHDGGIHHIGKVPARAGTSIDRQERIALLRRQLDEAITAEEYERAAAVRDELMSFEDPGSSDDLTQAEDERDPF